eukprot:GGOE01056224.1.p7 GENE.GGOE01056224.1~~GGOE01056224.1.p7  ORF type:complete len:107 (+),score=3.88 GGOE01056224.1:1076-1396(+)
MRGPSTPGGRGGCPPPSNQPFPITPPLQPGPLRSLPSPLTWLQGVSHTFQSPCSPTAVLSHRCTRFLRSVYVTGVLQRDGGHLPPPLYCTCGRSPKAPNPPFPSDK